jgi:hypothetical protein
MLVRCASQSKPPDKIENAKAENYKVIFPMNEYLTTDGNIPYPVLAQKKFQNIDTRSFINVMDYGASGDGSKPDDAAISKAFEVCKDGGGVLFPKGKIFLIQNLIRIPLNKNITVYAYGATFKMAQQTGYNAIAFECQASDATNVLWLGGTFDGNKAQQSYPGSSSGNAWMVTQPNYGFLTIKRAQFALVKDVTLKNTVYDGVNLFECALGVIADSKASYGANLNYARTKSKYGKGHQSTYFKCTRKNSQVVYFINLDCKEGSIGIQYSTNVVSDSSLAVVNNCHFYNQSQDAIHFESCRKIFVYKSTISAADNSKNYHADLHISNSCEIASIKDCQFNNGRIDFHNGSDLQIGIVEDCRFETSQLQNDTASLRNFIHNATYVKNCVFEGKTKEEQVTAKYIAASQFRNFDVAVRATSLIYKCAFENGKTAVANPGKPVIEACTFSDISNTTSRNENSDTNTNWKNFLSTSITVTDQKEKFLGYIAR